jgi:hypothetical protein
MNLSDTQKRALALASQRESMHWTPYRYQCNFSVKSNTWISLDRKGLITFNPYERRAGFWDITITEAGRAALQEPVKAQA